MARRRYHLASEPSPRAPIWLGFLGGGLILGLLVGSQLLARGSDGRDRSYLVMASTLFSQGEPVAALHQRLLGVGFAQPMVAVTDLGQMYTDSTDRQEQRQADALLQLGRALTDFAVSPAAQPTAQIGGLPAEPTAATGVTEAQVSGTPAAVLSVVAVATKDASTIGETALAVATPTASVEVVIGDDAGTPAPGALSPTTGIVKPAGGGSARLRKEPNVTSESLQIVPYGAELHIIETVQGEAVEPDESRWYHVQYGSLEGYVYYPLVAIGE